MNLIFRDHTISDLIGFVYSGMPPQDAAHHLMHNIRQAAQPVLDAGHDAVVPIILDGENAWEYYPQSGREFLRRFYDALQREPGVEAITVSEAIERHQQFRPAQVAGSGLVDSRQLQRLDRRSGRQPLLGLSLQRPQFLCPGRARGQRSAAPTGLRRNPDRRRQRLELVVRPGASFRQRPRIRRTLPQASFERLSGAGRASAGLSGAAHPRRRRCGPSVVPQTAYIHPRITGDMVRYFEWMGAAVYTADRRAGAMHGKQFLLDAVHAGIDEAYVYGRLDFAENKVPDDGFRTGGQPRVLGG